VASAEATYVDPSALRSLYIHDARSRGFCGWRAQIGGCLPITRHGKTEVVNSIWLAVFRRDIEPEIAEGATADLETDIGEGRLLVVDAPFRRVYERAEELSRVHTRKLGTRTLDVLHVASALLLGSKSFVTYDDRQAALAKAVRLRVAGP
jgi:predicted nucleic acid-binding protein